MKKLFFITCLTILFVGKIFGQAQIDIPFTVTDGTSTANLSIGLDLNATTCIDSALGEYVFNVMPPAGVFDSRLDLEPYGCGEVLFTLKDYRPPGDPPVFPFTGLIEYTLAFQTSTLGLPITVTINLPTGVTLTITDPYIGSLLNLGPFIGQVIATIPGTYTQWFTRALLKMEYNNIVPVEFTSFTASVWQNEKAVQLNWTTATETNNSGFEIQRTSPIPSPYQGEGGEAGRGWEVIGFVPGFGTTTEPKTYSFIDENVTTGTYKYRLKQIDFDGSFTYSDEIELEVDFTPKEFVLYQNYPNPFNPTTKIDYSIAQVTNVQVIIFNSIGEEVSVLVKDVQQPGRYSVNFDASSLSSGVYFYKLIAGDFMSIKKMILIK